MAPKMTEEHAQARRRQILEAACEVLVNKGWRNTTMRDICREAGLSAGAVYNYFPSKEDIIVALGEQSEERNRSMLGPAQGEEASWLGAVEGLLQAARWAAQMVGQNQSTSFNLDLEIWVEGLTNDRINKGVRDAGYSIVSPIVEAVKADQERGVIRADLDAEYVGHVVLSLVIGLEVQKALQPEFDIERYVEVIGPLLKQAEWLTGDTPQGRSATQDEERSGDDD
ncbi:MAG: hypothetical protein CL878_12865 [Dehalococcoidia bacterium]|nr:hypothetical protein [Dehalococcoidia bacterium]